MKDGGVQMGFGVLCRLVHSNYLDDLVVLESNCQINQQSWSESGIA